MLETWLTSKTVNIVDSVGNWKEAIQLCAAPLLKNNTITPNYINSIIELHESIGPYYVLAPGIAMPHARPEQGVNQLSLSMLLVKQGVKFNSQENDPVYLITLLAANDNTSHIEILTQLAALFGEASDIQKIFKAQTSAQILSVINNY
ncbi:PTS mannitol transporter subunit IIA [Gilliamella sp. Pra-s65]|uniref:PTS sugar transporter subunit IIA n=1 Tax=unclassified Gilliamella TaxID=2685620 RepID=UPI0013254851|nr:MULTISPECIES: PTS sugar transporter subunit IIA [unclassified Gilliamella]MWN32301.1 PTS mannitol transporter subunit IIA [Gilliamella sp. Pra-s60]MWN90809.1 PTS mannitol transporter subunit IIA [Gilliamella sp. Pra-s65]MWP29541.1 PTS mannitol transporter subunit IIA [Gilliamella sp. Pra-s54]MWP72130.1 PTS mannitol transporter subunit IIA [Gilliamella sp. Pra-s52]